MQGFWNRFSNFSPNPFGCSIVILALTFGIFSRLKKFWCGIPKVKQWNPTYHQKFSVFPQLEIFSWMDIFLEKGTDFFRFLSKRFESFFLLFVGSSCLDDFWKDGVVGWGLLNSVIFPTYGYFCAQSEDWASRLRVPSWPAGHNTRILHWLRQYLLRIFRSM